MLVDKPCDEMTASKVHYTDKIIHMQFLIDDDGYHCVNGSGWGIPYVNAHNSRSHDKFGDYHEVVDSKKATDYHLASKPQVRHKILLTDRMGY